ncbi:hypothetical protein BDK51DRAFT_47260 [Blyttiomyces helicus]|uniref:Uncharacterized protein n=1 Tax=Blyttiomyces helicus TaxID=388810 RepID=A0A4P9W5N9_9FUNG|nr:hypothetical protein BDK51DRAFT_47260 [Blyttiomyces helicus]|eukprot:RKO86070.1 hypothetical protein BDK51DRAFT_47260 [Blyttiomyces helicus]
MAPFFPHIIPLPSLSPPHIFTTPQSPPTQFPLDCLGGLPLPTCPFRSSSIPPTSAPFSILNDTRAPPDGFISPAESYALKSPTVSVTFALGGVSALVCAGLVAARFSSVKVFNRRAADVVSYPCIAPFLARTITDQSIKNGWWAVFFAAMGISYTIDSIRYALDLPYTPTLTSEPPTPDPDAEGSTVGAGVIDAWLLVASAILRSFSVLALCLALDHQRKYRSSLITPPPHPTERRGYQPVPASSATPVRPTSFAHYGSLLTSTSPPSRSRLSLPPPPRPPPPSPARKTPLEHHPVDPRAHIHEHPDEIAPRTSDHDGEDDEDDDECEEDDVGGCCGEDGCCGLSEWARRMLRSWGFAFVLLWALNVTGIFLSL